MLVERQNGFHLKKDNNFGEMNVWEWNGTCWVYVKCWGVLERGFVLLKKTGLVSASCVSVEVELLRERERCLWLCVVLCVVRERGRVCRGCFCRVMKQCRESERKRIVFCFVLLCLVNHRTLLTWERERESSEWGWELGLLRKKSSGHDMIWYYY